MRYTEYNPTGILKEYVRCFFTCRSDTDAATEDSVYASGHIEIMFNLGDSPQELATGNGVIQPRAQLWGQTIQPLTFTAAGTHDMLGVRFYPHTAAFFFNEPVAEFNDLVVDYLDIAGSDAADFYDKLIELIPVREKIGLLEQFLLRRLQKHQHRFAKLKMMNGIINELSNDDFFMNINGVSARYGMTSRYLQKLFFSYSGLSPHLYSKITRFQKSITLITENQLSLTTIAHRCGYYDQSHFIKDFKSFTGGPPSRFDAQNSTDLYVPTAG